MSAHCGACHSHRLVTAQRGDARFWLSTIRWMQRTQNLWQIPPEQEPSLERFLDASTYSCVEETANPAYRLFLASED